MKAILLIDMPECCGRCACFDQEYCVCNLTYNPIRFNETKDADCPLIPLNKCEEARINEILKERKNERADHNA